MRGCCCLPLYSLLISLYFVSMATHTEPVPTDAPAGWTIDAARALYNIEGWGAGFFDVNDRGHVVVRPDAEHPDRELDLYELATDLEEQGVQLPVLLRFSDILRSRLDMLTLRFQNAREEVADSGGCAPREPSQDRQHARARHGR